MPFDAGSVVGHFKLDTADYERGAKSIRGHNESMTASVFKAQIAYDVFKNVLNKVVGFLKDSVTEYSKHEQAVRQTEAILRSTGNAVGMTTKQLVDLSDSMMTLTGIEHDNVLAAENVLLRYSRIGKEAFPSVTQAALDMSVRMGTDASSAAQMLGRALQDPVLGANMLRRSGIMLSDSQRELIKRMMQTGDVAGAQAIILKEVSRQFGGAAAAARDTFGGAMANVKNQLGENQEAMGKYLATAGRPFVEWLGRVLKSSADWLNSAQGFQTIRSVLLPLVGAFSVAVDIGTQFWNILRNLGGQVLQQVVKGFQDVFGQGDQTNTVFLVLGGTVKAVSIAFTILGKFVKLNIDYIVGLVKLARDSIKVLAALADAITHPFDKSKWETVARTAAETWDNVKKSAETLIVDVKDIVKTTIDEFKSFKVEAQKTGDGLKNTYQGATAQMDAALAKFNENTSAASDVTASTADDTASSVKKTWLQTFDELSQTASATVAKFGLFSNESRVAIDDLFAHVQKRAGEVLSVASDAFGQIFDMVQMSYQNEQTILDNDYAKRKAYIEANVVDETDRKAQLAALDADYAKKSAEIKKKQWEAQRTQAVINAVISTANAVMTTFATFGWPWGIIPAAIMAGIGAAQVAMIASQPEPEFAAEGGVFGPGKSVIVGEQGPELLQIGRTSRVVPNGETQSMLGGGMRVGLTINGDVNNNVDIESATARMARKVRSAMRSL